MVKETVPEDVANPEQGLNIQTQFAIFNSSSFSEKYDS